MKIFNFSAGPAMLPASVIDIIDRDLRNWDQTGVSIMEFSHRTPEVEKMLEYSLQNLRALLAIPPNFTILLTQGGARTQFSAVPLNLCVKNQAVQYLNTGHWSMQAAIEAQKYAKVSISDFVPVEGDFAYTHMTSNETVDGIELIKYPEINNPLVIDATSNILTHPIDFKNVGIIYAAAQKNLGIAGLTVVIIRDDLISSPHPLTPATLNYEVIRNSGSLLNTPNVFAWYVFHLMLNWVRDEGGVSVLEQRAIEKSKLLYNAIDSSDFYHNGVDAAYRSRMTIPFRLPNEDLESQFIKQTKDHGLLFLKGHKVTGGIRASMYNAMPLEGVQALVDFMKYFEDSAS